jgi:hypothetical protein
VARVERLASPLLLSVVLAACAGCLTRDESIKQRETSHVRLLTSLHAMVTARLGRFPRDEQEFKQTIAKLSVSLEKLKVGSIDELFISERDGQPFVVVYGSPPAASDVVVFEQTGLNGRRQIGHRIGMVEEVDDARYSELIKTVAH